MKSHIKKSLEAQVCTSYFLLSLAYFLLSLPYFLLFPLPPTLSPLLPTLSLPLQRIAQRMLESNSLDQVPRSAFPATSLPPP